MPKPTGGPAFPVRGVPQDMGPDIGGSTGVTMRDWFAGHSGIKPTFTGSTDDERNLRIDAARAYRWADAMLAEREK